MGRKGKKANEPSLDDYWNEGVDAGDAAASTGSAPPAIDEEETVDLSKNKKKKKKKDEAVGPAAALDDEDEALVDLSKKNATVDNDQVDHMSAGADMDEQEVLDLSGMKKKKPKKKEKKQVLEDDVVEEEVPSAADVGIASDEELLDLSAMKKKKPKKKDKKKGLDDEGDEAEVPLAADMGIVNDEELLDLSAMKKKKPKKKDKMKGLDDEDEAEVASAADMGVANDEELLDFSAMKKKKPKKKDKKKGLDDEDDEAEVPSAGDMGIANDEEVLDLSAMKKKKPKKDKKKDLDDEGDEAEVPTAATPSAAPDTPPASPEDEEVVLDFSSMKKKKQKKEDKKKNLDGDAELDMAAIAAAPKIDVPDEEEEVLDLSAMKKKKPKKKEKNVLDDESYEPAPPAAAQVPAGSPDDEEELDLTGMKKKKGKKKSKKQNVDDDYPEVASQDWDVPTVDSASTQETKKEVKLDDEKLASAGLSKDSEAPAVTQEEEEKLDLPGTKKKKSKKKKPGEKKVEDTVEPVVPDTEGEVKDKSDDVVALKEGDAPEATSSSKKKKKKPATESQESKPKVVEKKVPKHVREMQERLAKMKEEEERRKREEEERLRKEEEERLRLEEEERLREEAKQRRKQREKEKIKEKKAKGLYLTGKQKLEARRLAMIKEQILASNPNLPAGEEQLPTPRKPKYETKKKKVTSEDANVKEGEAEARLEETENLADEGEDRTEEAEDAAEEAEPEGNGEVEQAAEAAEEDDEDDDWEAKTWDESKLPTVKDAFADEDEEEEEEPQTVPEKLVKAAPKPVQQAPAPAPATPTVSREARMAEALSKRSADDLRSPICCILGHVDTGKTKLLDCIRRTNVQEGEAGGITQQIGATYFPMENIRERTKELQESSNMRVPGLLVIDTPGHESFTNLRSRGSGLCDIAILVIDIMHGLEPQTLESINLLKMRKTPFIVALNKVDRLYQWKSRYNAPIRTTLQEQERHTRTEFDTRAKQVILQLQEQGLNSEIYWKNKDKRRTVSIVPTSAISGEGIPDLLYLLILLTQEMMEKKLMYVSEVQCTVLEVKVVEGLGTTVDVVLVNGVLHEGDQIVVCGMQGPIVTTIRALLTPHPMKELRVKGSYQHHKELKAAQGIKITAQGLEHAIAGTQLYVVGPDDDVEVIKEEAMKDMKSVMSRIDKSGEGVCVQASTLGSLEALLEFLKSPDVSIPVSGISIGPVHKKDIMRASVMLERKKEYATILAFDVKVTPEARELAEETGVKIFTADIIYHLFDQFTAYLKNTREEKRRDTADEAIFPCILKILPNCVFNKKDPIIVGVAVLDGIAKVGTPICVPSKDGGEFIDLGRIASLEINHKVVDVAKKGDEVAMKILGDENQKMFGRHFDYDDLLVSHITRRSIDILKENYRNELSGEEWKLIVRLKGIFKIM